MTHAVVIGGGVAGLLAAHALAPSFERVSLLERHPYPALDLTGPPAARRGVPQARCLHLLTAAGGLAVDQLVCGWRERAQERGAVPFDVSSDTALWLQQGQMARATSGMSMLACSRQLLEDGLREALLTRPGTVVLHEEAVSGLSRDVAGGTVQGVLLGPSAKPLHADLVVEASGAGSQLPGWLGQSIAETTHQLGMQYLSRWIQLHPDDIPDWHCLSIAPSEASGNRSAMLLRAERGHWGVVLLAPQDDPLPASDEAFLAFTQGLGDGTLHRLLARSMPTSSIHRLGTTDSRIRHFEHLAAWPDGLVALGDAVCRLDPYHGLGMTLAARGALLLAQQLTRGAFSAAHFQGELAALNAGPWEQTTRLRTDGRPSSRGLQTLHRLLAQSTTDVRAAHALLSWQQLIKPEEALLEPLCA